MKELAENAGYDDGNSFWAFTTSVATVVSVASFVILGGIGEYGDYKNMLARYGSYVGALALALIGLTVVPQLVLLAAALFVIARTGDRVSGLMIDGLLSDCCQHHAKTSHAVSANARFMGYVAMMTFGIVTAYAFLNADDSLWYSRIPIAAAGAWWFIFSYIGFGWIGRYPGVPFPAISRANGCWGAVKWSAYTTFSEHMATVRKLPKFKDVSLFVLSWMFLSDASSTASSLGTLIAEELGYSTTVIAAAVVFGIIFAALGMLLWMWVVKNHWLTPYQVLFINLCCQAAGALLLLGVSEEWHIFGIVLLVGVNLGPVSSYTRSIIVTMIPSGFQTNFLSFYELTQKGTAWIGPLTIGGLTSVMGREYFAIISIVTILTELLIGLPIFWMVDVERGQLLASAYGEAEEARKGFARTRGGGGGGSGGANTKDHSSSADKNTRDVEMAVVNPAKVNGKPTDSKSTPSVTASTRDGPPPGKPTSVGAPGDTLRDPSAVGSGGSHSSASDNEDDLLRYKGSRAPSKAGDKGGQNQKRPPPPPKGSGRLPDAPPRKD